MFKYVLFSAKLSALLAESMRLEMSFELNVNNNVTVKVYPKAYDCVCVHVYFLVARKDNILGMKT